MNLVYDKEGDLGNLKCRLPRSLTVCYGRFWFHQVLEATTSSLYVLNTSGCSLNVTLEKIIIILLVMITCCGSTSALLHMQSCTCILFS